MSNNCDKKVGQNAEELLAILSDIRAGNDHVFARLLDRYEALLRARVSAFGGSPTEAEDAYQEACLALHRAALHYYPQNDVTFGLYAKICVDNALKTKYRKDGRSAPMGGKRPPDFVPFEECRFLTRFSDRMVEEENLEELLSLIHSELSPYERRVFELYINDVPCAEIAARLEKGEKSVRNAINRLLGKLRKKLGN
ncbi:MAG: RNA polymerase sigma factor [Clostridia bacterium]|nr:RNA polymerase sigma factor [Clostridia bacterium]